MFTKVLRELADSGVRMLVTGDVPTVAVGGVRLTSRIDIEVDLECRSDRRLGAVLQNAGSRVDLGRPVVCVRGDSGDFANAFLNRMELTLEGSQIPMRAVEAFDGGDGRVEDFEYVLSDEQLLRGLAMTPGQRLAWLDEARRFALALRAAPRTYFKDGKPVRTVNSRPTD